MCDVDSNKIAINIRKRSRVEKALALTRVTHSDCLTVGVGSQKQGCGTHSKSSLRDPAENTRVAP